MKFSIIIPAHNSQDTIEKCISSIVNQKDVDIQIILVENGSVDDTLNVCRSLQNKYNNVELYTLSIPSVSKARNEGLRHVDGDIISFCDADDYLLPNSLTKVKTIFEQNEVQIVCSGFQINVNGNTIYRKDKKEKIISASKMIEYTHCNPNITGSAWNKFFKKEMVIGTWFRPELTHHEDGFFVIEVLSKKRDAKTFISQEITYCYIVNEKSVTKNYSNLFDENSNLKYLNSLNRMLKDLPLTNSEKRYTKNSIFRHAVTTMWSKEIKKSQLQAEILYNEIKKTVCTFVTSVFKFDRKKSVKFLVMGLIILVKERKFSKRNNAND